MAFNVVFHTFSKKERSTAVPSGAGRTVSCTANEPMDLLAPVISLDWRNITGDPVAYNYCYISAFSRYYWITGWTHREGLWWASLRVDPLASWKASIGAQNIYVFRSSYSYDLKVEDRLYPTIARRRLLNIDIPKLWTVEGANQAGAANNSGVFILGIVTAVGTRYYAMNSTNFQNFMSYLLSNNFYEAVLGKFGATEYPEAKVAINPLQFITSCKWAPIGMAAAPQTNTFWALYYDAVVSHIGPGGTPVPPLDQTGITAYALPEMGASYSYYDIDTTASDFQHPQADDRGDWLNYSPYTSFELFYPPFGLIELDPVEITSNDRLRIRVGLDSHATKIMLRVQVITDTRIRTIYSATADFGVEFPLSNVIVPGSSVLSVLSSIMGSALGAAGSAINQDYIGMAGNVLGGASSAVGSVVKGKIPHVSTMGGTGTTADMIGHPALYVTHWYVSDDDLAGRGRPLLAKRTLSAIPGYIMADPDEVSISCTEEELTQIRENIRAGFYYE